MINEPSTEELGELLPSIQSNINIKKEEMIVFAHFLHGNNHQYLTEYDKDNDVGFGLLQFGDTEYTSLELIWIKPLREMKFEDESEVAFDKTQQPIQLKNINHHPEIYNIPQDNTELVQ